MELNEMELRLKWEKKGTIYCKCCINTLVSKLKVGRSKTIVFIYKRVEKKDW